MQTVIGSSLRCIYVIPICALFLFCSSGGLAQRYDSITAKTKSSVTLSSFIAPAALIGTGLFTLTDNGFITKEGVREQRNRHFSAFSTVADDYLQYSPVFIALTMKAFHVESAHDWANTIALLIKSEVFMGLFVYGLKSITQVPRPDRPTSLNSFPSGHTAQAFTAATFLHKEFGKGRPWVSITAYTIASSVGLIRVLNDRHWVSDVLVGAGVGILLTNLVFLTHQDKWGKKKNMTLSAGRLPGGATVACLTFFIE